MNNPIMSELWITKYRPKTLDEIVLPTEYKEKIKYWIETNSLPNLLLIGPPGTGKTSFANVIQHSMNTNIYKLNSSEERGIDTIRDKIKTFVLTSTDKIKVVFFDEADGLTHEAQQSLRFIIEEYSSTTRFIFTANYDTFIQPIKDRFFIIYFEALSKEDMKLIVQRILKNENVEYKEEDVMKVIHVLYPSLRSIIQTLQINTEVTSEGKRKLNIKTEIKSSNQELLDTLYNYVKQKNLTEIQILITKQLRIDYLQIYRYMFNKLEDPIDRLIVAEYLYRDKQVPDKMINLIAMFHALIYRAVPFILLPIVQDNIQVTTPQNSTQVIQTETNDKSGLSINDIFSNFTLK